MAKAAARQRPVKPHQLREYVQHLEAANDAGDAEIEFLKARIEQQKSDADQNGKYWRQKDKETMDELNKARTSLSMQQVETQREKMKTQRVVEERDRILRLVEQFLSVQITSHDKLVGPEGKVMSEAQALREQHFVKPIR